MGDFIGGVKFFRGNGASAETFTAVPGLTEISGVGQDNSLVDATDFDSQAKEYVLGLPDGVEINLTFNDDINASTSGQLDALIDDVTHRRKRNFRVEIHDAANNKVRYSFSAVCLSWKKQPVIDGGTNKVAVTIKVSSPIGKTRP